MQSPSRLKILFFKIILWLLSFSLFASFKLSLLSLLSLLILIISLLLSLFGLLASIGFQSYFFLILFILSSSSTSKSAHWNLLISLTIVYELHKKQLSSFNQAFCDEWYSINLDWAFCFLSRNNVVILKLLIYFYLFLIYLFLLLLIAIY